MAVREHDGERDLARARLTDKRIDASNHVGHRLAARAAVPQCPTGNHGLDLGRRATLVIAIVEFAQAVVERHEPLAEHNPSGLLRALQRT